MSTTAFFTIFALFTGCICALQPGFKARITPKGLRFLSEFGIRELKEEISKIKIPDYSGSHHIKIIGTVDYSLTNMHVTSFNIPSASITTKANIGVTISAGGLSAAMHGDWQYRIHDIFHIHDHGSFDVSFSSVSISLTVRIGMDSTGRPTVRSQQSDCNFYVGDAHVRFHGGKSWLYNLFHRKIESKLKSSLNSKICEVVVNLVNTKLAEQVSTLKTVISISDTAEIDYSLLSPPIFNSSLTTSNKGEVYQIGHHTEAPFRIPIIPRDDDMSRMVLMWMTDFVPNSAGYVLHTTGFFQYNVTQDKIPSDIKVSLNTSDFAVQFAIPQIAKLYPNMMMQVNLNTTAPPKLSITSDKVGALVNGDISAYIIQPNKSLTYLFTLGATLNVSASIGFRKADLTWNSSYVSADLKLLHTAIDDFKIDSLRSVVQLVCRVYIIPEINKRGEKGVPVPSFRDYAFVNPVVEQKEGLLKIGTDIRYQKNWLLDPYEESSAPSNNAQNEGTYSTESSLQGEESSVMPLDWENLAA